MWVVGVRRIQDLPQADPRILSRVLLQPSDFKNEVEVLDKSAIAHHGLFETNKASNLMYFVSEH